MKKITRLIGIFCIGSVLLCAGFVSEALTAPSGNTIIILPFKASGANASNLSTELPELFARSLREQGFKVIPPKQTLRLVRSQKVKEMNVATARSLAKRSRATHAMYGAYTGTEQSFSIDARLVSTTSENAAAQPYFVQRNNMLELLPAVNEVSAAVASDTIPALAATPELAGTPESRTLPKNGVADIQIRGLKILDPDAILMRLSTAKGDSIDEKIINQEIKRLWDTGYFSDVSASIERSGQGLRLVFTVVEKPRIDDVQVNGSDEVSKSDILAAMSSKTGAVLNEKMLSQDIQKITDLYRKKGFYLAEVTYSVKERQGSASAVLVFDVKEGKKLYIKKIAIEGLETIDEDDIKKTLALQERGLLSFFTKTGVLREEHLERDTSAISAYGLNHGYIDMQVSAPKVTYEEDGIVIVFNVKEGKQYKIGEITFAGDLIDTPERLQEIIQLDEQKEDKEYFVLSVMQDDTKRLTDFYSDYGYAFASVTPQTNRADDGEHIDIRYQIDKKHKIYVRRVGTQGNTRTRDNVILREMRLGDGDLYDGAKIRRSNERLNRLRYFTAIDTAIQPTDNPTEVDLSVNVKEDQTGAVMGGFGYSTYNKFGVTASIEERNLFGKGYSLGLRGFTSARTNSLDLSFINPRVYDTDLGIGYDAYAIEEEWDDFDKKTVGNTIRFSYPLGEYTSFGVGYRLDQYRLYNIPKTAPRAYREYEGSNLSSVASARLTYDSTDSSDRPTRGYIFRTFLEYGGGGLGGNDNFFKPLVELQGFHTLFSKDHILHWRGRAGAVYKNTNKPVPVFDRFFIGGIDSIRGYDTEDIAPRDPGYGDEIGGDRMAFFNLEYIWTVEPELGIAIVPFFDIGFQNDSAQHKSLGNYKKSVGLELRWRSPMGDLRFAYGYPLDKSVTGEKLNGRFEFSMGQNF